MTEQQLKDALKAIVKGANTKVALERPVKLLKAYKGLPLFKRTLMTVRIGVPNDGRKATIEARENGERPAENQGLKGLEWVEAPILLRSIKNPEQLYLRMEPSSNKNERCKPVYFIREAGVETVVEKADYAHMMQASEKQPSRPFHGCFNSKIENITMIGKVETENEGEGEAETV
jgi:hypothetical protein